MKPYSKLFMFALAGVALAACSDDADYEESVWDAADGYQNVSFVTTSLTEEKDPTDATVSTIQMKRTNTNGAATVPFEILQNDDDVFTVGTCTFADGDSLASFEVSYPNAEIGVTYTLMISVSDKNYVSSWTEDNSCTLNVTRVKWNELGTCTVVDNFWYEASSECTIYQRDDDPTQYRIEQPFYNMQVEASDGNFYPAYMFTFWSEDADDYLTFRVLSQGEVINGNEVPSSDLVFFETCNIGYYYSYYGADICIYHPASLLSSPDFTYNKIVSYQEDGSIGKVQLAPYYYMSGVGGWNYTTDDDVFLIYFPGYTDPVEADITSESDFTWSEVFTGDFASGQLGTTGSATLYRGTCQQTADQADEKFYDEYGTAYYIASPYAEGYNLYFTVDEDGNIQVPDEVSIQPLGITAMGEDVYATINSGKSSYSETEIVLNITFTNADGSITYGTADEVLSNITYSAIGTASYTYALGMYTDVDADGNEIIWEETGLTLEKRDDKDDEYRLVDWLEGTGLYFTWNRSTNEISIPEQGIDESSYYGTIYISDLPTYSSSMSAYVSSYDTETSTATLYVIYYVSAGYFTYGAEYAQFDLNSSAAAKAKKIAKANAGKNIQFNGKRVKSNLSTNFRSPWASYTTGEPTRLTKNSKLTVAQ